MFSKKNIISFFAQAPKFFLGVLVLLIILNFSSIAFLISPRESLKEGDRTDQAIKSPKTVYYKSQLKTKEIQEKVAQEVAKVYIEESTAKVQQESKITEIFRKISEKLSVENQDISELSAVLNISEEALFYLKSLSFEEITLLESEIKFVFKNIHDKEMIKNDQAVEVSLVDKYLNNESSNQRKFLIKEIVMATIIPNYDYSEEETNKKIEEAKQGVAPVTILVTKDEVVVSSGKTLDSFDIEKLEAVGLMHKSSFDFKDAGLFIFSLIIILIIYSYFNFFYQESKTNSVSRLKAFYVFVILFLTASLSFFLLVPLKPVMAYLFPVAAFVILISILTNQQTGLFSAIIFSAFLGGIYYNSIELIFLYLTTSLAGIYRTKEINKIMDIFSIGFFLIFFAFATSLSFHLIAESFSLRTISVLLGASAIYGFSTSVIIFGSLMFWGNLFKITTLLDLLELENPHQEVLREFSIKAPGTYQHSLMVSNLARQAAKDIEANVILCGVGALYHDIGKMEQPDYFIENQKKKNIHQEIKNPEKSAAIIKSHVESGLLLGRKKRLPSEILSIMASHHGDSEVFYFLNEALKNGNKVDIKKFRYEGPLPQTKEEAIIMLADSIEALTRAEGKNMTTGKIEEAVNNIIDQKIESGQLREVPMSFKELEKLRESFKKILSQMYHKRIKYGK